MLEGLNSSFREKVSLSAFRTRYLQDTCSAICHRGTQSLGVPIILSDSTVILFFPLDFTPTAPDFALIRKPLIKGWDTPKVQLKPGQFQYKEIEGRFYKISFYSKKRMKKKWQITEAKWSLL